MNYSYLKPYVHTNPEDKVDGNFFVSLSEEEILEAEQIIGAQFPSELRAFYQEIGYGFLTHPHILPVGYKFYSSNLIHAPSSIALILNKGVESGLIMESTLELLSPGDWPMFEIGDSTNFLIMKPFSDNPNAIWDDGGDVKIDDSFAHFIWRLFYESPSFYGDIIEDFYKNKP